MEPSGPLTPDLYRRLEERFGAVMLANQGEEMIIHHTAGKLVGPPTAIGRPSKPRVERLVTGGATASVPTVLHFGEYYRVCCPKCQDTRFRLWVSHRAVEFPMFIVCYNEDCYNSSQARDQLLFQLFKTRRPAKPRVNRGKRDAATLRPVELPGDVRRLDTLPLSHPANEYLADDRGYDPWELGRVYGVGYCESSARWPQCNNKIIIPIEMNGRLVGWQARFIGERNWKASAVPKYWDMPGMPKRLMLYNHDRALTHPWVGLQEGVTDVWSTGPMMMSLLGSTITFAQRKLLAFAFRHKPLVMMLDGDAMEENQAMAHELRREHPGGVVTVTVPNGADPGDFQPAANLDLIYRTAREQGVVLPGGPS